MPPTAPLNRAQAHNALRQIESELSPAVRRLADQLLTQLDDAGSASVKTVHEALFPMAETSNAAAQLSTLAKKIEQAAQSKRLNLKMRFSGAKKDGVANRRIYFAAPRPTPMADTEGLDAIVPKQRITGQLATPLGEPRILLLTYNDNEFAAVRAAFWSGARDPATLGTGPEVVDDLGLVNGWRMLHGHSRQGNRESQRSADAYRRAHSPYAIIAVGIAFGINPDEGKQSLGDVLVSKFIVDYETVRVNADGVELRGARPNATRRLVQGMEQLATRKKATPVAGWPTLHFGGVLTGEKLVDDRAFRDRLLKTADQGDLIGGEMEAAGLFTALDDTHTGWLVVKAICDFADGNKHVDKEKRQRHAAANAAAAVHALLMSPFLAHPATPSTRDGGAPPNGPTGETRTRLRHDTEALCLRGPHVGEQLAHAVSLENIRADEAQDTRPKIVAFEHLLNWLSDDGAPPLYALLGEYGMGKTTHCQTLTRHLEEQRDADAAARAPLYFDLRKVERIAAAQPAAPGHVATLEETVQDCLRNGYLQTTGQAHTYQDVLDVIDDGAVVIFDGLDEVLSRITDSQGLKFTANLLKVLPEARQRQQRAGRSDSELRLPKVLLSCRTQFFRNLAEQNSHLTGEHRGGNSASQYLASVLQPFTDEQIRSYLHAVFPDQDVAALMAQIAAVHNLRELAGRPFTLKLVAQFVPRIQSWQQQGRTITGATLYREVAREWLLRDKEKQSFQPQDKERLASDLAAHLWRSGQRGLRAIELEQWLDAWLGQLPRTATVLSKPRELLHQDLRNATFLKRSDATKPEDSRFEFAHTSLQEFFLADYLFRTLQQAAMAPGDTEASRTAWALPKPSDETLDFLGQILAEAGADSTELRVLSSWRKPYRPLTSELQLAYALRAYQRGWPMPVTAGSDLRGANLSDWHFGSLIEPGVRSDAQGGSPAPMLDLSACDFSNAKLRRTRFWRVRLDDASFAGAAVTQGEVLHCSRARIDWQGAELDGMVMRPGLPVDAEVSSPSGDKRAQTHDVGLGDTGIANTLALHLATGHGDSVWSCAFSPDGQRALSGSNDHSLKLWDANTGECLRSFTGHTGAVSSCAFSPEGERLLSGSGDNSLKLWDVNTGECLRSFTGHTGAVSSCAFSPEGERLLSGSSDNTLKLWNADTSECLRIFTGHIGEVTSCAFSPDGQRALSGSRDNTVKLWNANTGECLRSFTGHTGAVSSCAFSPEGERLLSGSGDNTLKLWNADTGECLRNFTGHTGSVKSGAFSPDGKRVLSGSADGTLMQWDTDTGERKRRVSGHIGDVMFCAFSPDGQRALSGSSGRLTLWDAHTGECLRRFGECGDRVWSNAFSLDGQRLLSGSWGGFNLWAARSGECLRHFAGGGLPEMSCAFSPDGQRFLSRSFRGDLKLWDADTGECLSQFGGHHSGEWCCAFSPNGQRVLSGSDDNTLKLWDVNTGECQRHFTGHTGKVWTFAFSPDGKRVLSGSDDNTLKLWDANTGECRRNFTDHAGMVWACAFSPDGHRVLSCSSDRCLKLWDAHTGECLRNFMGHAGPVLSCAFSPDGQRLLSGSIDNTLKLWDANTGECLFSFTGYAGAAMSCPFSPDGQRVLSGSLESALKLWDTNSGECVQTLLAVPQGTAAWDPRTGKLLHASGRAWRYLRWQGHDANGQTCTYPLESVPGVVVAPWTLD